MDIAYDHIQEEALPEEPAEGESTGPGLNEEFQEAFKAVSLSPWGAKLGGFLGQLKTQGESLYTEAQKEYTKTSEQASKGLTDLRANLASRARAISIQQPDAEDNSAASFSDPNFVLPASPTKADSEGGKGKAAATTAGGEAKNGQQQESLIPADIVKEATSMVSRFRAEAVSKLATVRQAEDAADEALLRFGTNVRNFLRDAVVVSGPAAGDEEVKSEVLFETNDAEGKRVFHSSRFDARLHAIHVRTESFASDPEGEEWDRWTKGFDVGKETDRIAADLEKYEELRRAMEKLVPEKVEYKDFWRRYYFLRMAVEEEERRRKEVLKGAAADNDEEVGWGDDDEDDESSTPVPPTSTKSTTTSANLSTSTLLPPKQQRQAAATSTESAPRPSQDEKSSSADSDASYDLVSGVTSRTPGTPMMVPAATSGAPVAAVGGKKEESDDEDWE